MPWNSTSPSGSLSVKANRTPMNQNTTYIQTTMGNSTVGSNTVSTRDHFWNVSSNVDGRHRFIQSPKYTSTAGLVAPDDINPVIGTGMDGVLYPRTVNSDVGRIEYFWRNSNGIYQATPSYVTGTHVITSSFTALIGIVIPKNVFGEIIMFRSSATGNDTMQFGYFKTTSTNSNVLATRNTDNNGNEVTTLRFNGNSSREILVRTNSTTATGNTWEYRITYRAHNADG